MVNLLKKEEASGHIVLKKILSKGKNFLFLGIGIIVLGLLGYLPFRQMLTRWYYPTPQGILVLGGEFERTIAATQLARQYPQLPLWVSDFSYFQPIQRRILTEAQIAPERITYDTCAKDTVTNLTCTVDDMTKHNVHHLYLVTSDYHLPRATAIANIVLASRGIVFTPYSVPHSLKIQESPFKTIRDQLRALLWLFTGRTGASWKEHPYDSG